MTRERIDEMTVPPVVGHSYLVPTVTYPWFERIEPWPVMGPKHTDAEHLRFEPEHYHVDIRFLSERQIRFVKRKQYCDNAYLAVAAVPLNDRREPQHPPVVYRKLLCRRVDHGYPLGLVLSRGKNFQALHAAYAGKRCARNAAGLLICPHKGFPLDTLSPDAKGRVICPLHGLVIDVAAGVVVDGREPTPADGGERG